MRVRKAVIPAAGQGTRFLPATKVLPKEMIPVIDKPAIQYAVEECARAGIDDILIVTGMGKSLMEDHFDRAFLLEQSLEQKGKTEELEEIRRVAELARVHSVRQKEPLGLGQAVLMGREHVGDEPFAVLLPDEIVPAPRNDEPDLLSRMIEVYEKSGSSVITVQEIPHEQVSAYGVVRPEFVEDDLAKVLEMVEKPAPEDAPSDLGARGRYVFSPAIFELLEQTQPGVGGEIQLTDAIQAQSQQETVYAYIHPGPMFDVGKKLDYLRAVIQLALRRDELAKPLSEFLTEVVDGFS